MSAMDGSLTLVTAAADEGPVPLDTFKSQARIDYTAEDALLRGYLRAAVAYLDGKSGILGRALMTQTWDLRLPDWPTDTVIEVPLPPLISVTSVSYVDEDGATQTWATSNYQVDSYSTPGRIVLAPDGEFPSLRGSGQINQVTVRFVAGYGANPADVPQDIRHAIAVLCSHWYQHRGLQEPGMQLQDVPMAFDALIAKYRVYGFG